MLTQKSIDFCVHAYFVKTRVTWGLYEFVSLWFVPDVRSSLGLEINTVSPIKFRAPIKSAL